MSVKIAITSDMHLWHWLGRTRNLHDPLPHDLVADSIAMEKPDLIIDAGDLEAPDLFTEALDKRGLRHVPRVLHPPGNHDFYGKWWHGDPGRDFQYGTVCGLRIASATLWTDFNRNDPLTVDAVRNYLNDFRAIRGFTTDVCYAAHIEQRRLLVAAIQGPGVDVAVTHHGISQQSVHPRYKTRGTTQFMENFGFVSDMDDIVMASGAKLWVHGHVHDPFDYMIGETRVVVNPCGYPGEHQRPYAPVYVTI